MSVMSQHRIRTRLKSVVSRGVAPLGGHAAGASRARAEREDPAERSGARRPSLVDNGVYVDGCRVASPATLADTFRELDERPEAMAWIGLYRPTVEELQALAEEFDLHELAVEDAVQAHQRPKTERYSSTLFTVLRAARYVDDREEVEFGELHVFLGRNFVITVRHAESPDLSAIRTRMQERPELLSHGPQSVLYAILDAVVDGYAPVVTGLANDIDEIEDQVFDGDPAVSRRIYELSREVIDFQRAVRPLGGMLQQLQAGSGKYEVSEDLQQALRDVADHVIVVNERVEEFRVLLRDILTVNSTLVGQRQNEEMRELSESSNRQSVETRKISGWAAILFAPTLVSSVYGMNFDIMPELHWDWGYPFSLVLMLGVSGVLYGIFRKRDWI
ncbi:magnesium and cobalt transport protein CorA [Clavibacter michiganensis]|uniref:magnesium and cobalt transport protein CorA n=1 Tax=Clavibacter michiganensis TaxID=28447 RepID=UPI000A3C7B58|nr:magnesium and cobalt transport protein CorA [Clavibacter michiganensis]MDO4099749.1 magnesium and cobalt transport protein CorA [Clavibacter michiganensis]MDO4128621.1 magnesium and cobalt transport protein CorA [Clavibacter michiganensis]MWJ16104.1 magnesium and cobalt transport protein CorA [Clavibacter michiganensis subsp. michiganensis]NIY61305.1 transporter [Clavibacter michiganensis subsp. michiganensis]QXP02322.1 magnesium and cobalt transport protein CorA [Clavibacter michiganensis 